MNGEEHKDAKRICVGDIIDVAIDFDSNRKKETEGSIVWMMSTYGCISSLGIFYWLNEELQGYIHGRNQRLKEGELYPCVNMSTSTEVGLR